MLSFLCLSAAAPPKLDDLQTSKEIRQKKLKLLLSSNFKEIIKEGGIGYLQDFCDYFFYTNANKKHLEKADKKTLGKIALKLSSLENMTKTREKNYL